MSRFLSPRYEKLSPYTPGEQPKTENLIKLNTNECPYPPSPGAMEVLTTKEISSLRLYPDPSATKLVEAIADYYGLEQNQIMVGNGSDEILAFCFMAFQNDERKIYYPDISYGFYPVYSSVFFAKGKAIPLDENLKINIDDYKNLAGTIIIANPNAPTGIALDPEEIEQILRSNKENLVIIDEAYIDFGGKSCVPLISAYDNLLIIQTFSKSRALAGARIGFAMGNTEIIQDLNRIKFSFNPYNMNRLSILAGAAAMRDVEYFEKCTGEIQKTREHFVRALKKLGFDVLPSSANFIFARNDKISGEAYYALLRKKNILVRHFNKKPIEDYVRITIGLPSDMETLLAVTEKILEGEK